MQSEFIFPRQEVGYSRACYESCPCQHQLIIDGKPPQFYYGDQIYQIFLLKGIPVPKHFLKYAPEKD